MLKRLCELREERGLTQDELSKILSISRSNISKYENGELDPNTDIINKYADYFDCSTDYIYGRTNDKKIIVVEGEKLPEKLRGIIDSIGIAKYAGLSDEDIQEILQLQAKMKRKS